MTDQVAPPRPGQYWFHRRLMAYWSLVCLSVTLGVALFGTVSTGNAELLGTLAWIFGLLVITYFGGNAAEAFANRR